jgi:hypothetical protein
VRSFEEIQEEVHKEFELLGKREKSKLKHQLIIEALNETIIDSELWLIRWRKHIEIFRKHIFFSQLAGFYFVEVSVLLKERVILELNHFLEDNRDSININYLFNVLLAIGRNLVNKVTWNKTKKQIQKDKVLIKEIKEKYKELINYRDREIAHSDRRNLGTRYEDERDEVTPEVIEGLIVKLKNLLSFYFENFNIKRQRDVDSYLKGIEMTGFETGLDDLVFVVNKAFEHLTFGNEKIQKLADKYLAELEFDF